MPPSPAYNWFCVLASTAEILSSAARYRAAQLNPNYLATSYANPRKRRTEDTEKQKQQDSQTPVEKIPTPNHAVQETVVEDIEPTVAPAPVIERVVVVQEIQLPKEDTRSPSVQPLPVADESVLDRVTLRVEEEVVKEPVVQKPVLCYASLVPLYISNLLTSFF